jgi:hypothetical protein
MCHIRQAKGVAALAASSAQGIGRKSTKWICLLEIPQYRHRRDEELERKALFLRNKNAPLIKKVPLKLYQIQNFAEIGITGKKCGFSVKMITILTIFADIFYNYEYKE